MARKEHTFRINGGEPADVLVTTPRQTFFLHSSVLKSVSRRFSANMSGGRPVDGLAPQVGGNRYYYGIDYDREGNPGLQITGGPQDQGPIHPHPEQQDRHCTAFRSLFECFYRQPVVIRSLEECTAIVALADGLEALDSVTDSIRASFFEWPELDIQIKEMPKEFLVLGYKLKSVRVFKEAFIHVVGKLCGQHDALCLWAKDRSIPERVVSLVREECSRLVQLTAAAVRKLQVIGARDATADTDHHKLAVAILREKLGSCWDFYQSNNGCEGALFRMIVNCRFDISSYDVDRYSSRAHVGSVLNSSTPIAAEIKMVVKGLVKNNLRLKEEMEYLTCAELSDEALPWVTYVGGQEERGAGSSGCRVSVKKTEEGLI